MHLEALSKTKATLVYSALFPYKIKREAEDEIVFIHAL